MISPCSPLGSDIWTTTHCLSPQLHQFPMGCFQSYQIEKTSYPLNISFQFVFFLCVCFKKVPDGSFLFICCTCLAWQIISCGDVLYLSYTAMQMGFELDPLPFSSGTMKEYMPEMRLSLAMNENNAWLSGQMSVSLQKTGLDFQSKCRRILLISVLLLDCCIQLSQCDGGQIRKVFSVAAGNLHVILNS